MLRSLGLRLAVAAAAAAAVALALAAHTLTAGPAQGTIVYGSFQSAALRGTDHYAVYLPPGYSGSTVRYPVIYFLHGLPAGLSAYKQIGIIERAVDASGRGAIVVGVQGARDSDRDPEWLDWGPGRNWETATAVELVRVIDHRYRTVATRAGRLLVGISAGGYGATLIANHHPGTFGVIESWSGYFHPTDPTGSSALDLGSRDANEWADFGKQIPHLRSRFGRWFNSTYFDFYVGTDDARFRAENEKIARALRANHVPHVLFQIYPGGHEWALWEKHAPAWIGAGLASAAQPHS